MLFSPLSHICRLRTFSFEFLQSSVNKVMCNEFASHELSVDFIKCKILQTFDHITRINLVWVSCIGARREFHHGYQ